VKALVWFLIGLYVVPFLGKYVQVWRDRRLNR
jgi:hypothetical protein